MRRQKCDALSSLLCLAFALIQADGLINAWKLGIPISLLVCLPSFNSFSIHSVNQQEKKNTYENTLISSNPVKKGVLLLPQMVKVDGHFLS